MLILFNYRGERAPLMTVKIKENLSKFINEDKFEKTF
jgi:CHASE2 domain-containing sensor protein